jgi:hypothetical protein
VLIEVDADADEVDEGEEDNDEDGAAADVGRERVSGTRAAEGLVKDEDDDDDDERRWDCLLHLASSASRF